MCRCNRSKPPNAWITWRASRSSQQWTFPGKKNYESRLLLVDHRKWLHQAPANLPQMPGFPRQKERTTITLAFLGNTWPFLAWGIEVIGAISPKFANGHEYILMAVRDRIIWSALNQKRKVSAPFFGVMWSRHLFFYYKNKKNYNVQFTYLKYLKFH